MLMRARPERRGRTDQLAAVLVRTGVRIAERIDVAEGTIARMRGLLGRSSLEPGSGFLLDPCRGIHTVGMRFAIDVLFLDRTGRVARVAHDVGPGRFVPFVRGASRVIELPPGTLRACGVERGDEVWLVPADALPEAGRP